MDDVMLDRLVAKYVTENLQWFFDKYLKEHYNRRRENLNGLSKKHETQRNLIPAIDYILSTCIGRNVQYPPDNALLWHEYYSKLTSGSSHVFQQLLLIYMKLDLADYLKIRERDSTTGRQTRAKDRNELYFIQTTLDGLMNIPKHLSFPSGVIKLSTGLWALDNDQMGLMLSCLSNPSVNFSNYFGSSKDIVQLMVGTLHCQDNSRVALYINKIHRYENWDDEYDPLHAYLLIQSGQIVEALKYERLFMDQENYAEVLLLFFELCSRLDVTKALNCLNLSVEEEEAWNQHLTTTETRPATPSSFFHNQTQQAQISTPARPTFKTTNLPSGQNSSTRSTIKHTPRNRNVHALRKVPSFNDSPARNTRSARKKKSDN